jgi:C4-type Zn-finger protein
MLRELFASTESIVRDFEEAMKIATTRVAEMVKKIEQERKADDAKIEGVKKKKIILIDNLNSGLISKEEFQVLSKNYESDIATLSARSKVEKSPVETINEIITLLSSWKNFYDIFVVLPTKN